MIFNQRRKTKQVTVIEKVEILDWYEQTINDETNYQYEVKVYFAEMIYDYKQKHHYKAMEYDVQVWTTMDEIDDCAYEHEIKIDRSETPQANDYYF